MGTNRGFTLIELMVTIAVMAVVASMAAPSFGDMITTYKLNKTTRELISAIHQAKSQAALIKNSVALCLNRTNAVPNVDFSRSECASAIIPGYAALTADQKAEIQNTRVISVQVASEVLVESASATRVLFNDIGSANTSSNFSFCRSKNRKTVSVTRLGIITQATGTCP